MRVTFIMILFLVIFWVVSWIANVIKLANCDFNPPYKGEVIHSIGLVVPGASIVTAWIDGE